MPTIDGCRDSSPCRSMARDSSSIWIARWSPLTVTQKVLRLATIRAIEASDPMTPYSAGKRTPRFLGRGSCGAAGTGAGREERLACGFLSPPPDLRELRVRADAGFGSGPVLDMLEARSAQYSVVARLVACWKRTRQGLR